MSLTLLLAWRFLRSAHLEKNIATMTKVCFSSIFISSFALTLIAAIMNGFEKATHAKLQGVHADIIIQSSGKALNAEKIKQVLSQDFKSTISELSPVGISQVIIQNTMTGQSSLVMLKGVNPEAEVKISALKTMLTATQQNRTSWPELLSNNNIFLGEPLAKLLSVSLGDTLTLLFEPEELSGQQITLMRHPVTITGLFKTGINEFDEHVILSSLDLFKEISNTGITQVQVKLRDKTQEKDVIQALKKRLNLEVYSWKDLYPALVSALSLEKYAMIIILALVTLIASMNLISLLFMYITQKQSQIALLRASGLSNKAIIATFLCVGITLVGIASAFGIAGAVIIVWLLNNYMLIPLPDAYYITHLPAHLDMPLVITITILLILISLIALVIPLRNINYINIAQTLKAGGP